MVCLEDMVAPPDVVIPAVPPCGCPRSLDGYAGATGHRASTIPKPENSAPSPTGAQPPASLRSHVPDEPRPMQGSDRSSRRSGSDERLSSQPQPPRRSAEARSTQFPWAQAPGKAWGRAGSNESSFQNFELPPRPFPQIGKHTLAYSMQEPNSD